MKPLTHERKIIALLDSHNEDIALLWHRFLDYYATKDRIEGSDHCHIIAAIFAKRQPRALKHVALACELHLSERTLYRYRINYLKSLRAFADELGLFQDTFADNP